MRISVIIPCHNAAPWIGQALRSVVGQTSPPHEIIVVDDASSDDSATQVHASGVDCRLLHIKARNAAIARNRGIDVATGDWIALLDADDLWYPNHLARAADFLEGSSDIAYRGFCDDMDVHGTIFKVTKPQPLTESRRGLTHHDYPELEWKEMYFGHSGMVVRLDRLLEVGAYDPAQVRRHDIDMWLRVIYGHTWCYDALPTVAYRLDTPGSICRNLANCEYYYLKALLKNRERYDGPIMTRLIEKTAKRAISLAFMNGTPEDFLRARQLTWLLLPASFRAAYRTTAVSPRPLRFMLRIKRWLFTLRSGYKLDRSDSAAVPSALAK